MIDDQANAPQAEAKTANGIFRSVKTGITRRNVWLAPERWGTLGFFLAFFIFVGVIEGTKYLSVSNLLLVLGENAHEAVAAAAVTLILIAGEFDLSVGALVGLCAVLLASFTASLHMPVLLALGLVVLCGAFVGLVNGALVCIARVNAFIATLGTGSALGGLAILISHNNILYSGIPTSLTNAGSASLWSVPAVLIYAVIITIVMSMLTRQTRPGRYWSAIGSNKEAARLAGVKVRRFTMLAFVGTAILAAIGGVILPARFGSADPTTGPDLLLPAYAASFLGLSILSDGSSFTMFGTVIAAFLIAFASDGLEALGLSVGVQPIFNGAVLIAALALTAELRRRRSRVPVYVVGSTPHDDQTETEGP